MARLLNRLRNWIGFGGGREQTPRTLQRGPVTHVIILDGTMSSLDEGHETNAGRLYKMLCSLPAQVRPNLRYASGVQWRSWRNTRDVLEGRGINRQIRGAYGFLASRYHTGDKIFLFGYSRGAFAVRSLAGVIDRVGLLKPEHATVRNIRTAYRLYQGPRHSRAIEEFQAAYCRTEVDIQMVGVWDTVKALGMRLPFLWRLTEPKHAFHNHKLGRAVKHGYHALALDENRSAFAPVLWSCPPDWHGDVEQMWFRGTHGDIGGQLSGFEAARPLANIPLVWMLEKAEAVGLTMPEGWRATIDCDPDAPSVGSTRGWGMLFVARSTRVIGRDISERVHETVPEDHKLALELRQAAKPEIKPEQTSQIEA
ncbi:DUF2235 domain-containing protein [Halocynthiibacter sp. C4]|uniref:DUF2235 domain-containing protein n=1 Tax=Halocynthiibacter sp. C4 TaxID=2992758 RepID=UPI00237C22F6|nr:DUF2235 domain-containing protein [Halocynthiibacter sp. C4]MDE0588973.1 DUF2235 domain-containing protein [Halocynthiibacter sp. C4]